MDVENPMAYCEQQLDLVEATFRRTQVGFTNMDIEDFMLPEGHPLLVRHERNLWAKIERNHQIQHQPKRRRSGDNGEEKWVELHRKIFAEAGLLFRHPDEVGIPQRYAHNPAYILSTPRKKSCINYFDAAPRAEVGPHVKRQFIDVYPSLLYYAITHCASALTFCTSSFFK